MFFQPKTILKTDKKFYTIDIETYSLSATKNNLWFGCIYGENYKAIFHTHQQFYKLLELDRFKNSIIYAHNGGGFDYLVLFENLIEKGAVYVGSRFIYLEYKKILFADSMNFYKTSVEKIGKLIGLEKTDLENKGNIQRGSRPTEKDIEYCYNDCRIIYKALKEIFQDNRPCLTVGSLSLQIFQRHFLKNKIKFNPDIERMYLDSYFGGRTEAFKLGNVNCEVYDINSMYPYAMKNVIFPHPSYSFIKENVPLNKALRYIKEKEGMIKGTIRVPKTLEYMPLPFMDKKLIFPSGDIKGSWCINEVRYALSLGCELLSVDMLIGSSRMLKGKDFFGEFIDHHYSKKENSTGIQREFHKMVLNNLYGKFGQHNFEEVIYFKNIKDATAYIQKQKKYYEYEIKQFNKKREDCTVNRTIDDLTKHSIISIASYITAYSRIMLHQFMMEYKPVYCDTDSLFIPVENTIKPETSTKLGELKKEDYLVTYISGCKSYTKVTGEKIETKIKGIPKKAEQIDYNKYSFNNILKPKKALRMGKTIGEIEKIEKTVSNLYTKGEVNNNNITPFNLINNQIQTKKVKKRSIKQEINWYNPENFRTIILKYLYNGGKIGKKQFLHSMGHLDINKNFLCESLEWEDLIDKINDFDTESILNRYYDDLILFSDDLCEIAMRIENKRNIYKELKEIVVNLHNFNITPDNSNNFNNVPF